MRVKCFPVPRATRLFRLRGKKDGKQGRSGKYERYKWGIQKVEMINQEGICRKRKMSIRKTKDISEKRVDNIDTDISR